MLNFSNELNKSKKFSFLLCCLMSIFLVWPEAWAKDECRPWLDPNYYGYRYLELSETCTYTQEDLNNFSQWLGRRGFITQFSIPGHNALLEPILAVHGLEKLWITGGSLEIDTLKRLSEKNTLNTLGLERTSIVNGGEEWPSTLVSLHKLKLLELREMQITNAGLSQITQALPHLETLLLGRNLITAEGLPSLLGLDQLMNLELSNNALGEGAIAFLSRSFPLIERLYLNEVGPISRDDIVALSAHNPLTSLKLKRNHLVDDDALILASGPLLAPAPLERVLNVALNDLTAVGVNALYAQQKRQNNAYSFETRELGKLKLWLGTYGNPGCSAWWGCVDCSRGEDRLNWYDNANVPV